MKKLKIAAALFVCLIAIGIYFLLSRYLANEEISFLGSSRLQRVLVIDLEVKNHQSLPRFLPESTGFLVIHAEKAPQEHREDILESKRIFEQLKQQHKNSITASDLLYSQMEVLFLQKNVMGLRAHYVSLAAIQIRTLFFDADYLRYFLPLYTDRSPHAAGYAVLADGRRCAIHDILVEKDE
jgi:hypothetical protein